MNGKKAKKPVVEQSEIKEPNPVQRHALITTDGNTVKIRSCDMPLLELKASLEIILAAVIANINQLANAANAPAKVKPEA